jgi:hypothetical protein
MPAPMNCPAAPQAAPVAATEPPSRPNLTPLGRDGAPRNSFSHNLLQSVTSRGGHAAHRLQKRDFGLLTLRSL